MYHGPAEGVPAKTANRRPWQKKRFLWSYAGGEHGHGKHLRMSLGGLSCCSFLIVRVSCGTDCLAWSAGPLAACTSDSSSSFPFAFAHVPIFQANSAGCLPSATASTRTRAWPVAVAFAHQPCSADHDADSADSPMHVPMHAVEHGVADVVDDVDMSPGTRAACPCACVGSVTLAACRLPLSGGIVVVRPRARVLSAGKYKLRGAGYAKKCGHYLLHGGAATSDEGCKMYIDGGGDCLQQPCPALPCLHTAGAVCTAFSCNVSATVLV